MPITTDSIFYVEYETRVSLFVANSLCPLIVEAMFTLLRYFATTMAPLSFRLNIIFLLCLTSRLVDSTLCGSCDCILAAVKIHMIEFKRLILLFL